MKVLVIGATGQTGSLSVRQLLEQGHEVTAFARNPAAVSAKAKNLRVVQGDVLDAQSLDRAVQNQDAILCAIGPRSPGKGQLKSYLETSNLEETAMRNLVAAMQRHGVKRVVHLSALGLVPIPASNVGMMIFQKVIVPLLLKKHYDDKERAEVVLVSSGLDYVIVRPGRLLSAPARGGVRAAGDIAGFKGFESVMTYEDLAAFMVSQLTGDSWVKRAVLIGY